MLQNRGLRDLMELVGGFRVRLDAFSDRRIWTMIGAAGLVACGLSPWKASAALILGQDGMTVYDTVNNVTWLADANLAATDRFGLAICKGPGPQPCVNASGSMSYQAAAAWVAAMNAAHYLGHTNWQLPTTPPNDTGCGRTGPNGNNFGFGCTASAFGSLWNELGLHAPNTAVPIPSNTVGPFSNFQPYLYWSQSGAPPPSGNFTFSFATGWQGANTLPNFLYALPMIPDKLPGTPPVTGNGLQVNPGGQTVYDPVTNITWLASGNLAATNTFGLPTCKDPTTPALCVAPDGAMTFASASQFIENMNSASYLGQTNWQLPTIDSGCPGYNCAGTQNQMGNLFYDQLNFGQGMTVVTAPDIAIGPLHDIQPYLYWTCGGATIQDACQIDGPIPHQEWSFSFGSGFEGTDVLANDLYVTAYFVGPPTGLCAYSLSSGGQVFLSSGGSANLGITVSAGCGWNVFGAPGWIAFPGPMSGVGNGSVTFQVQPNSGTDRTATLSVGGANFTIEQEAASISGLSFIGSMPHVPAETDWNTTFTFVNKGTTSAIARTNLFARDGTALTLPLVLPQEPGLGGPLLGSTFDQTIAPNASFVMEAAGLANSQTQEGSAQLLADGSVDGFAIFHFNPNNQEAVVPMETRNAASYLLAFDNTDGVLTGVALANVSAATANIPVVIRDDTGTQVTTGSVAIAGSGHTSFVLSTQYPSTANIRGTIEFDTPGFGSATPGQISALGIRYTPGPVGGTTTTIPALANVGTTGGLMAHLAVGTGWETTFVLVNTGGAAAQAHLKFFDKSGNPLPLPLSFPQAGGGPSTTAATLDRTIAAGASLWVRVTLPAGAAFEEGSAQLSTDGNIGGFEIFRYDPNGQEAVVPLESRNAPSYLIAYDNTGGIVTGIAISSLSSTTTLVPVTLRDDTGAVLGTGRIPLSANGHISFAPLATRFPQTAGLRGTIQFDAPQGAQISVLGIRTPPALTFTTLSALAK